MIEYRKVVVLGAGESGVGAALLAKAKMKNVFVSDFGLIKERYKVELINNNIPFEEKGHDFDKLFEADLIVKSPGISDQVNVIKRAVALGIPIVSEVEFASWYCQSKLIAVTGSNGKTTTVSLIYHVLDACQLSVVLCGNIGSSFARAVSLNEDAEYYVVEVSSFQLDNTKYFKPNIAVLLNISADHLDRYEYSMQLYAEAKLKLFANMTKVDTVIINSADEWTKRLFSNKNVKKISIDPNELDYVESGLIGAHNQFNIACALAVASTIGLEKDKVLDAISHFDSVKHRLEKVRVLGDVEYINDSKATNIDSVKFALDGIEKPIIWIVGGVDKGNDYSLIIGLVREKVKKIICLTKDDSKIREAFTGLKKEIVTYKDMRHAVYKAKEWSEAGDVVLLSPACASFDLFNNYEHRGNAFCEAVVNLTK